MRVGERGVRSILCPFRLSDHDDPALLEGESELLSAFLHPKIAEDFPLYFLALIIFLGSSLHLVRMLKNFLLQ